MKLHDAQLRRAAVLAMQQKMNRLPQPAQCAEYVLSPQAELQMQVLLSQARQHCVPPARIHFGWQYYAKRSAAALLLGMLLTGIAAPELVQAAYQRLIEAVETVFDAYTQYHYTSHVTADTTFVPLTLHYLPEGMQETRRRETKTSIHLLYEQNNTYFIYNQKMLTSDHKMTYGVDTEDAEVEVIYIDTEEVYLIHKDGKINYIWLHNNYHISGRSNLSREELLKILQQIE